MNIEEAIDRIKRIIKITYTKEFATFELMYQDTDAIETLLSAYEKEKEKNKEYEKQLDLDYAEKKIKEAYIDGTNVAHNLCNKKWEDKIKAKIEEIEEILSNHILVEKLKVYYEAQREVLQSLLEKE